MAHVFAARAVLPSMLARGEGYLLNTASAAGLLMNLGNAPYTVTKHAAVGFAEWLAVTYGDRGIKVSCLCPQGVRTNMLLGHAWRSVHRSRAGARRHRAGGASRRRWSRAWARRRFLILPHPEVADYVRRKAEDPDRWLAGMRRLQRRINESLA